MVFWLIHFVIGLTNSVVIVLVRLKRIVGTRSGLTLSFAFGVGREVWPHAKRESQSTGLNPVGYFVSRVPRI